MLSSKGQIGLMETIIVLVIIVILIIMGIVFYFKAFSGKVGETKEELSVQEFSVLLNSISSLPEFQCSEGGVERNCIDRLKLDPAEDVITNNRGYYFDKFGYKEISFEQIYPAGSEWTVYSNLKAGAKTAVVSTPVSLYNQTGDEYYIGKLVVEI